MHPRYKERNSGYQLGGSLILPAYALTQSFGCSNGSGMVLFLGLAPLAFVGLTDGVVPDLGLAPLGFVGCHWFPSLFGMVIWDCIGGHVAAGVGRLQASLHSLVAYSGHSRKPAKPVDNYIASPRSLWFGKSNCTSFCAGLPGQVLNSWFLAMLGELLSLGILGVAIVEGSWKSNVTTNIHAGSMMGSWREYWRESRNVPHPVLGLFVVGYDATVVCPYCMNISV